MARVSFPPSKIFKTRGLNSHMFANTILSAKEECLPKVLSMPAIGGSKTLFMGCFSMLTSALASTFAGLSLEGEDACPPLEYTQSSTFAIPFSARPTTAVSCDTPGNTPLTIAPPSSSTSLNFLFSFSNSLTISCWQIPPISSSPPKVK